MPVRRSLNVLLVGESWFTYSIHQKGFDTFQTAEYTEGAGAFIACLDGLGHSVPGREGICLSPRWASAPSAWWPRRSPNRCGRAGKRIGPVPAHAAPLRFRSIARDR